MRAVLRFGVIGLLLAGCPGCGGCGKGPPVRPPNPTFRSVNPAPPAPAGAFNYVQQPLYQGQPVEHWGRLIQDPNLSSERRFEAAKAMEKMGAAAAPYLIDALKNGKSPEVRVAAMEALTPAAMSGNDDVLIDSLLNLLKDRNDAVRQQAAFRLSWFDHTTRSGPEPGKQAKERMWALQAVYHFDGSPAVRLAARNSMLSIYDHMRRSFDCPPVQDIIIERPPR